MTADNVSERVAELPAPGTIYRTLGQRSAWERVGCGVMDKRRSLGDHSAYLAPTYSVIWVVAGRGRYRDADGQVYPFAAGDCFHRWPGREHSTEPVDASGWYEWFADCGPGLHTACADARIVRPDPPVWRPAQVPTAELEALRIALAAATTAELGPLATRVLDIIARSRDGSPVDDTDDLIQRACTLLADEALGRGDLRSWCREHGLGYERFRKAFTQRMGEPPGQYRIRRRMERACALLLSSDRPIGAVADDLGYASPYEFSAQFRRRFGLSPSAYRQQTP